MADEIQAQVNLSLSITRDGVVHSLNRSVVKQHSAELSMVSVNHIVTDTREEIDLNDLGELSHIAIANLPPEDDQTPGNSVYIYNGDSDNNIICALFPGDVMYLPSSADRYFAKTITASKTAFLAVVSLGNQR